MRLASYNLCNLAEVAHPELPARKPRELRAMSEVMHMMDADVIVVQEVASDAALRMVNERLKRPYAVATVVEGNYYRGLHLGVMSRYPVVASSHKSVELTTEDGDPLLDFVTPEAAANNDAPQPLRFQRDVLRLDITARFGQLIVFCVHLKSHAPAPWRLLENDVIRKAETRALVRIVKQQAAASDTPIVVAGDFNETPNRDVIRFVVDELQVNPAIENDWVLRGHKPSYSYQNYPKRARLDYVFLDHRAQQRYVAGSACIHGSPSGRVASDHYPISVDLA